MTKYVIEAIFILYAWYTWFGYAIEILNYNRKADPFWDSIESFEDEIKASRNQTEFDGMTDQQK